MRENYLISIKLVTFFFNKYNDNQRVSIFLENDLRFEQIKS